MRVDIVSLAQRTGPRRGKVVDAQYPAGIHAGRSVADVFFEQLPQEFPDYQLLALDEQGAVVGKVNSLPLAWAGSDDDLPARGWDAVLERGFTDRGRGTTPTAVSLLEVRVVVSATTARISR